MAKNWIAGALKNKGSLRKTTAKEGLIKGKEKLSGKDLDKLEKSKSPKTRKRAELAETLGKMRKK